VRSFAAPRSPARSIRGSRSPARSGLFRTPLLGLPEITSPSTSALCVHSRSRKPRSKLRNPGSEDPSAPFGTRLPRLVRVPSLSFLPTSTACSTLRLAGLLHPAADHEVRRVFACLGPDRSPRPTSSPALHPSELSPRWQPLHVTAQPCPLAVTTVPSFLSAHASARFEALRAARRPQGFGPPSSPLRRRSVAATPSPDAPMGLSPLNLLARARPARLRRATDPNPPEDGADLSAIRGTPPRRCTRSTVRPTELAHDEVTHTHRRTARAARDRPKPGSHTLPFPHRPRCSRKSHRVRPSNHVVPVAGPKACSDSRSPPRERDDEPKSALPRRRSDRSTHHHRRSCPRRSARCRAEARPGRQVTAPV
jgi:hypothetical protein